MIIRIIICSEIRCLNIDVMRGIANRSKTRSSTKIRISRKMLLLNIVVLEIIPQATR